MSLQLGLFFAALISSVSFAATFEVPVQNGDRLVLKGLEAQVQMLSQPGTSLKISGVEESPTEGAFLLEKKGNVIEIKMREFDGKKAWLASLSQSAKFMKKIEISGLAVPAEINLRGGSVVAQKWGKELKINLQSGRVATQNGVGSLAVTLQKGEISVTAQNGKVTTDMYSGRTNLKDIIGDMDVTLFAGQLSMENVRGFISSSTQQATAKIVESSGTLQFENGKGSLSIQKFQGRMEGQVQDGTLGVSMTLDSELDVKAKSGKITVYSAANSGASVNLFTVEGEIFVPNELRVVKSSAEKSARGRLRGDSQRGSIFVHGQDASIILK
jgi:hypothetical protein